MSLCLLALVFSSLAAVTHSAPELDFLQIQELEKRDVAPKPPTMPCAYEAEYTFTLPYTASLQATPVSYPVHIWYDCKTGSLRTDTLNGTDKTIEVKGVIEYEVVPMLDHYQCFEMDATSENDLVGDRALPDPSHWEYAGDAIVNGRRAVQWLYREAHGVKDEFYRFYFDAETEEPLLLSMLGQDYFTGSHYDEYVANFTFFKPGMPDGNVFAVPDECDNGRARARPAHGTLGVNMRALIPRVHAGDPEYDQFVKQNGRFHSSPHEYLFRLELFNDNKEFVLEWNNRTDVTHTVEVNQFADWTDDEFLATKMGRLTGGSLAQYADSELSALHSSKARAPVYKMEGSADDLPESVDWQGTGADTIVKDQAACGSCWAFAASSAMTGAYFVKTGHHYSFSEQQIVDCAWKEGNYACDGGWAEAAVDYAHEHGIVVEDDYAYVGQDGWCRADSSKVIAHFSYVNIPTGDQTALKEAVQKGGPCAVAIDASQKSFRFYSSGVYTEPLCSSGIFELDHAVTLVGYGTENDKGYWKIRNSWSPHWGDNGYVKIDMEHDCGVTTDAILLKVDIDRMESPPIV